MHKASPSLPEELAGSSGSLYIGTGTSGRVGCHSVTVNLESLASVQCRSSPDPVSTSVQSDI